VFLERVPGALRNWEWHHVKGTLDQSLSSVAFPQGDVAVHFREATEGGGAECSVWIAAGDSAGELEVAEWAVAPGVLERRSAVGRYSIGKRCAHLAFSADGRRLAAIDEGGTLHVFSLPPSADPAGAPPEGREMEAEVIVENPEAKTWDGVAFHPALPLLALSCTCGVVEIRDAADGACAARLAGHTQLTRSLAFSPDGSRLVSTSYDKTARIWDVERSIGGHPERGACVAVLRGHDYYVVGAAFRPDGRELATASLDGTIKLWDVARSEAEYGSEGEAASGALKETLRGHESGVRSVAYHPGGEKLLASASVDRTVRLWSLEEEAPIGQWGLEPPRLWHVAQRAEIARLRGHRAAVEEVAFSPAGELVVSKGYPLDGTCELRMWLPFASGESPVLSGHGSSVHGVAWSFDGSLVASAGGDGSAGIWDAKSGAGLARLWHPKVDGETTPVLAVRFHPGEKALATGTTSGTVRLWRWREDPRQFEEPLLIDWPARPAAPPGSKRSWWGVASLAMSDDGSLMASGLSAATLEGEYHHRVEVWRWEAGAQADAGAEDDDDGDAPEPLAAFPAAEHLSPFQPVAFLGGGRAGRHLVTPGAGSEAPSRGRRGPPSSLQVFEVDWPGREVRLLSRSEDLDGAILDVAVLPGGDPPLLAAGLADGTVHLWSVLSPRQLEPLRVLRGHTAPVTAVAFHPDPRASRLASGSNDRALKLWDLAAGLAVYSYEEHHGTVNDLEFGPLPGAALASASAGDEGRDNVVRLLEAAVPGEWVERRARTAHAERQVLLHLRPVLGEDTIPGDLALDLVRGMDPSLDATAVELLRFRRGPEKVAALAEAIAEHAGADGAARDRALAWVRTALAIDPGHEGLLEAEKSLRARGPEARGAEARGAEARGSTP
jgi:WD40 repeat protein